MPFTYGGEVGSEKHIESPCGVPTAADFRVWCPKKKVQSQSFQSTFTLGAHCLVTSDYIRPCLSHKWIFSAIHVCKCRCPRKAIKFNHSLTAIQLAIALCNWWLSKFLANERRCYISNELSIQGILANERRHHIAIFLLLLHKTLLPRTPMIISYIFSHWLRPCLGHKTDLPSLECSITQSSWCQVICVRRYYKLAIDRQHSIYNIFSQWPKT